MNKHPKVNPPQTDARQVDERVRADLESIGLGAVSLVALDQLDASLSQQILNTLHGKGLDEPLDRIRLLLIGNTGGDFWREAGSGAYSTADPIDDFSTTRVTEIVSRHLEEKDFLILYPGDCGFSLQRLGLAAGFGVPSWLGIDIHPEFGTWFAYRVVIAMVQDLPITSTAKLGDICANCRGHECLMACPVDAPGEVGHFDLNACVDFRLTDDSPCALTCVARENCPVGQEFRYGADLLAHVYGRSLGSIRRWRAASQVTEPTRDDSAD
ncbi:MAG: hypothetical protein DHS20C01_08240 [marine bacterium B5-7]|nr:MAG: hypothetical protein DHS20C01_08240 [marine bacterium B5-7]